jgi:mycothiol synthase
VEHRPGKTVVATALATHSPTELHPFGAQLGWVAADPEHKGRKLGTVVSAAATARMLQAGYRRIYLQTDDFRLPAIKVYLDLGYEPLLYCEGMAERWQDVEAALAKPR